MLLKFEWDIEKAKANYLKHVVTFVEATEIWRDEYAAFLHDPAHSELEDRFIMVGYSSSNNLLFVSFTERESNIRIISVRKATKTERKRHEEGKGKY